MRKAARLWAGLLLGLVVVFGMASAPYSPPEGGDEWQYVEVMLKGTPVDADAEGKAVLMCNTAETQHRIQLQAQKVVARGVYSVWLIKLDGEGQVLAKYRCDDPERPVRADTNGKLAFASNLPSCPWGRYTELRVSYHPDGDSKNVAGAKTALTGDIPKE